MDENKKISDEQLENVSGGGGPHEPSCYFTTSGEKRNGADGGVWAKCNSNCGVWPLECACRGKDHCVNKWHLLHGETGELYPSEHANHTKKLKSNNYNT